MTSAQRTILLVEDEPATAEMLKFFLELADMRVMSATNGREALACLEQTRPDLVLSDVMMPRMDGRQLSKAMQSDPAYRSIPVVLMSAAHDGARWGVEPAAFLPKPLDLDLLLQTIRQLADPDRDECRSGNTL
jgi:CheY-like chemotaxis protein